MRVRLHERVAATVRAVLDERLTIESATLQLAMDTQARLARIEQALGVDAAMRRIEEGRAALEREWAELRAERNA